MSGVSRHPSDATLLEYGSGGLSEGHALVVATHLAFCASCRKAVSDVEIVGGALLDELPPSPMNDESLARAMSRIGERPERPVTRAGVATPQLGGLVVPEPLRSYLAESRDRRWRAFAPGVRRMEVRPRSPAFVNTFLLRVAPGLSLPRHGHSGPELTVVLTGSFSDELGRFQTGDVAEVDEKIDHRPVADTAGECVCLIAVQGPLRFTGLVGRMMQLFTRI